MSQVDLELSAAGAMLSCTVLLAKLLLSIIKQ